MSTGDVASRFARYAFRRHFFQHLGFRLVRNIVTANQGQGGAIRLPIRVVSTPVFVLGVGLLGKENTNEIRKNTSELFRAGRYIPRACIDTGAAGSKNSIGIQLYPVVIILCPLNSQFRAVGHSLVVS